MSLGLDYIDTVQLVQPVIDAYGAEKIGRIETVKCLFISKTGSSHSANEDNIDSDASLYIDTSNQFVLENCNRLEEYLIISSMFGSQTGDSWYKIINVSIGVDKLLNNEIDNIKLSLKKTVGIQYVS